MSIIASLSALIFLSRLIVVGLALIAKLWFVDEEALSEIRELQGGFSRMKNGELKEMPARADDIRVLHGMRWDPKSRRYVAQARLATCALRSAFPL